MGRNTLVGGRYETTAVTVWPIVKLSLISNNPVPRCEGQIQQALICLSIGNIPIKQEDKLHTPYISFHMLNFQNKV
jgi:hypothetical protein